MKLSWTGEIFDVGLSLHKSELGCHRFCSSVLTEFKGSVLYFKVDRLVLHNLTY